MWIISVTTTTYCVYGKFPMQCPYCSSVETKVVDKRGTPSHDAFRRRRECLKCGKRFTTYERIEKIDLIVIKRDGRKEPFDRNKIKNGILKAGEKRLTEEQMEKITDEIEKKIRRLHKTEIPSKAIGEMVLKKLLTTDKVAYLRFASVYKTFMDVKGFEKELKQIKKEMVR